MLFDEQHFRSCRTTLGTLHGIQIELSTFHWETRRLCLVFYTDFLFILSPNKADSSPRMFASAGTSITGFSVTGTRQKE